MTTTAGYLRRTRPRWLERHWRPAIIAALVVLAVAGGYAIRSSERATIDAIHDSQLKACHRGNLLRAELQVNVQVLDALLSEAARARAVQAAVAQTEAERASSRAAVVRYRQLEDRTRAVPLVDCHRVIPHP